MTKPTTEHTRKTGPIDIVLVTYKRPSFLKKVVKSIYHRTRYPHRLWVVNNGGDDETAKWLKKAKLYGYVHGYILADENKGLANGFSLGFEKVESEFFICTQDDIIPPDLNPCWLERMLHLAEENPEYCGISMRIQRTRHRDVDEFGNLIESPTSLASVCRISKKADVAQVNGFGSRPHWESTSFVRRMEPLKKKFAMATHLYADHIGFMPKNKGFDEGFTTYHTYAKERVDQGADQPYPDIDSRSNVPLKVNTPRDSAEQARREAYWDYWGVDTRKLAKLIPDQQELAKYAKGRGIDIGCGHMKCHPDAIGVDVFPFKSVDVLADARDLWMFEDGSLDYVLSSHSLEHFPDTKAVLAEWKRVLKPGGVLAVAVPDGGLRPQSIKGSHKVALTKEVLRIIFKFCLNMRVLKVADVPDKRKGQEAIVVVAKKR